MTFPDGTQAVDDVREFAVEIESDQLAADFRILLDQDGNALTVNFHVGDGLGQFIKIAERT